MKLEKKLPKRVSINPQEFDIELATWFPDDADKSCVSVHLKLGTSKIDEAMLTKSEARKIGQFFAKVAEAMT